MGRLEYKNEMTKEISFPLGGIGTGSVGISGNGRLIDWEIYNKPNKGSVNGFTHFAIKAEDTERVLDAKVLNGCLQPPYTGLYGSQRFNGYGFGPDRATMAGLPHFQDCSLIGEFPVAEFQFADAAFPGKVTMTAFNPFIPLNDKDSSIPAAFFAFGVTNTGEQPFTYTIGASICSPFPPQTQKNTYSNIDGIHLIQMECDAYTSDRPEFGDVSIATDCKEVSYQEYWYRGRWFDNLETYWQEFTAKGGLTNRTYMIKGSPKGRDVCTLAGSVTVLPGESKVVRFVLSWNFPNCQNYWNPEDCGCEDSCCNSKENPVWKNYYATLYEHSKASAVYALNNWERLYSETMLFKNALFSSTLPDFVLDAVSANLSTLKSPTCLRLEDGSFYGFEGCHCQEGCCEGSCTHVWNYAYALPFLFPKLERSMRDLDFRYNQDKTGGMAFRLQLPLGRERSAHRACADGQFGGVMKVYRDWKISGDDTWLKKHWDAVKKSIEYAWSEANPDRWDLDRDGVLEGRQHHTLDMELFGPSSWLTGFYLAALKAGAEMADYLGENQTAQEYKRLFEKGRKWVDEHLFNGEYYYQQVDLNDKSILESYDAEAVEAYWNDEKNEIKYQVGEGCLVDQVLAQWHANLCGLGEIFDREQVKKALGSIYKYNFVKDFTHYFNPCRLYSLNDEAGVVICSWPEGKYYPKVPVPYATETMNGFEYQAAIHMIQEGMVKEGLEIAKAIRSRYDGERRNPWNEFECGSNYARSMASYALLLALSGFQYNMAEGMMGFDPVMTDHEEFCFFWSLDSGWGTAAYKDNKFTVTVLYGEIKLKKLGLPKRLANIQSVVVKSKKMLYTISQRQIVFSDVILLDRNTQLTICC